MKKFLTVLVFIGLVFGFNGCGGGSSSDNNTTKGQNFGNDGEKGGQRGSKTSTPGPFTNGEFGRININDTKYSSLGRDEGGKVVEGAVFVDIRNQWERENGQPLEAVKDLIVYEYRKSNGQGGEDKGHRYVRTNEFINEMNGLVKGDKNRKIVLICHSGSRTQKAAKLLSENGFTNVYDIDGGYIKWEQKFNTDSYSNIYK
jgi:rhodanese-related sulfurtransferase